MPAVMIAVFGYAVLLKYGGWILLGLFGLLWLRYGVPLVIRWLRWRRVHALTEAEQAAIYEAQMNRENREWLEAGLYEGNYPAATMPLTSEMYEPRDWYDDDWGLPPDWSGIVRPK